MAVASHRGDHIAAEIACRANATPVLPAAAKLQFANIAAPRTKGDNVTAPGWYPDPSGDGTQRYWDGNAWGPSAPPLTPGQFAGVQVPVLPPLPPKKNGRLKPLLIIGGLLFAMFIFKPLFAGHKSESSSSSTTTSSTPTKRSISPKVLELDFINACQGSIKKQLKDPDSAKFGDDWTAWPVTKPSADTKLPSGYNPAGGDKQYSGGGSVNAKNSFGGYVGNAPYLCEGYVTSDGSANAYARSLEDALSTPPSLTSPPPLPSPPRPAGFAASITGTCDQLGKCYGVKQRTEPKNDAPQLVPDILDEGASVKIACQSIGELKTETDHAPSNLWFRLTNGAYINSIYITPPGGEIPRCG
jgi:hypothetical protein